MLMLLTASQRRLLPRLPPRQKLTASLPRLRLIALQPRLLPRQKLTASQLKLLPRRPLLNLARPTQWEGQHRLRLLNLHPPEPLPCPRLPCMKTTAMSAGSGGSGRTALLLQQIPAPPT